MYLYTMYKYICRFVLTYKVAGKIEQVGINAISTETRSKYTAERRGM